MVTVIRCKQHNGTFCDRYGTAFYDLKTPEDKVQRAIQQGLEGFCPEAVARVEDVHPTTVQRWIERACEQAKAADRKVITDVSTENVELDELYSFAGAKHPDEQENDLDEVGQHWTHCAMARESRLLLEVVVGPRTQESATKLVEGAAKRLALDCWPLWSSDGWEPYLFALMIVFAVLVHFIKGKGRGRPKHPQVVPDPRALRQSRQAAQSAAIGGRHQTSHLRHRGVDSAQTNLDLAVGTPERDNPPARRTAASEDAVFCQVARRTGDADPAFQELLQPVPEAWYI
jgi:hypothetical protein